MQHIKKESVTQPWVKKCPDSYTIRYTENKEPYFLHIKALVGDNCEIGRYTYLHGNVRVTGVQPLKIGNFCSIANNVTFHCGDEHDTSRISSYPFETILGIQLSYSEVQGNGVSIGSDVWIGEGVRILSGSKIGHGVVLGAGCVFKGKAQPYGIYLGNPARLLRKRFDEHTIKILMASCWWDWPLDKIYKNSHFFSMNPSGNIDDIVNINRVS